MCISFGGTDETTERVTVDRRLSMTQLKRRRSGSVCFQLAIGSHALLSDGSMFAPRLCIAPPVRAWRSMTQFLRHLLPLQSRRTTDSHLVPSPLSFSFQRSGHSAVHPLVLSDPMPYCKDNFLKSSSKKSHACHVRTSLRLRMHAGPIAPTIKQSLSAMILENVPLVTSRPCKNDLKQ